MSVTESIMRIEFDNGKSLEQRATGSATLTIPRIGEFILQEIEPALVFKVTSVIYAYTNDSTVVSVKANQVKP